jgi:hypothetical protein
MHPTRCSMTTPRRKTTRCRSNAGRTSCWQFNNGGIDVFDAADAARLAISKKAADRLVQLRLARFSDDGRTRVDVTNAGR